MNPEKLSPSSTFQLRCLVGLMENAPEAFEAEIIMVPKGTMEFHYEEMKIIGPFKKAGENPSAFAGTDHKVIPIHRHFAVRPSTAERPHHQEWLGNFAYDRDHNRIVVEHFTSTTR